MRRPDLAAEFPGLLEEKNRPPVHTGDICLVRPDGYVAMTAKDGDWNAVRAYLHNLRRIGTG